MSTNPVERNDVDISKLFDWGKKFTINWLDKKIYIYVRIIGDADLNRSRIFALRNSAELRRKLLDYKSDERLALIADYQAATKDNLIDALILYSKEDFATDAIKNVDIKPPKELSSEATLEQQEAHQKEIDEYPKKKEAAVLEYITMKFKAKKDELNTLSKKDLYDRFAVAAINENCRQEFVRAYREMCAYYGTYKEEDYKNRFFSSYDEFNNIPPEVKAQIIEFYNSLEISMNDLKSIAASNAIASLWSVAKNLLVPLDTKLKELKDLPYTISYVIRKRLQIDNLNELPKEKRPPDKILWDGTPEDLDDWLEKVLPSKNKSNEKVYVDLKDVDE